MATQRRSVTRVLVVALLCDIFRRTSGVSNHPLCLLVIFDGFRWDYMNRFDLPTFHRLAARGVRAKRVINVMPTMTMATHYTMLTGLYPESHGIVLNNFRDPKHGEYEMYEPNHQTESRWFDTGAEPIWVTNQNAAPDRFSGAMMWPTTLAPVKGVSPTFSKGPLYDINVKNKSRIDTVIEWFLHPDNPINLGLLYFEEPDLIGHAFGPDSVQIKETVIALDGVLSYLVEQLKKNGLFNRMNIIITADHGMSDVPKHQYIDLSEFVPRELYKDYNLPSVGLINPKPGKEEEVYEGLLKAAEKYPQLKVYKKTDKFLQALNYRDNDRISSIVVLADEGWYIVNRNEQLENPDRGFHGYLPSLPNMQPFFIATGPEFNEGYYIDSVRTIDFYELMCRILRLTAAPNNGSLANIKHVLKEDSSSTSSLTVVHCILAVVFTSVMAIVLFRIGQKPKRP